MGEVPRFDSVGLPLEEPSKVALTPEDLLILQAVGDPEGVAAAYYDQQAQQQ